MFLAIVMTLVN